MSPNHTAKIRRPYPESRKSAPGVMSRLLKPKRETELNLKCRHAATPVKHSVVGNYVVLIFLANSSSVILRGVLMRCAHFGTTVPPTHSIDYANHYRPFSPFPSQNKF